MSLQVWLPLNGDLHNQGLSDVAVIRVGGSDTNFATGKIGQGLSCNGSTYWKVTPVELSSEASICCWSKTSTNAKMPWVLETSESNKLNLYCSSSYGYTLNTGDAGDNRFKDKNGNNIAVLNDGEWHHFVVTFGSSIAKLYIDGIYRGTASTFRNPTTSSSKLIKLAGGYKNDHSYDWNGMINDFRVYDHCLSAKEVEEIAKGLVLHYKLDEPIQLSENLMPNHLTMALGTANSSTGTWRTAGSTTMSKSRVLITDSPEGECYGFQNQGVQTPNDGSCYGIDSFPLQGNTTYTISMWARIINGTEGYAGYNIYNISAEKGGSHSKIDKNYRVTTLPSDGSWIKCWYTFTTNASNARNIYIGITTGDTDVTTQMCCVHIEKIDKTTMQIYDSSGYNNNGTIVGNLTASADTPRYNTSTNFVKTSYIKNDNFIYGSIKWSVSLWYFKPTAPSGYESLFSLSKDDGSDKNKKIAIIPNSSYIWFKCESGSGTLNSIQLNKWTHLVLTSEGKVYENGVEKLSITPGTGLTDCTDLVIGARSSADNIASVSVPYEGKISDVRMYAIALTPDQILELYNTSATIDKSGNIYAREFKEQ